MQGATVALSPHPAGHAYGWGGVPDHFASEGKIVLKDPADQLRCMKQLVATCDVYMLTDVQTWSSAAPTSSS